MATIGIFDSGVGGLSVFREIRRLLPDERYIFYGDNAHCPYGPKGADFIRRRSAAVTELLIGEGAQVVVVACNTATSNAIDFLRERYDVPFVGIVPAVKPAALHTRSGVVGVLATKGTLNADLYKSIRDTYGAGVTILERIGEGFVELVESMDLAGPHAEEVVRASIEDIILAGADTLVLGCTHYPFLEPVIRKVASEVNGGREIEILDPAPAVARRLKWVLEDRAIPMGEAVPQVRLLSSGSDEVLKQLYATCC